MKHRLLSFILTLAMLPGFVPGNLLAGQVSAATGTCYVDDTATGLNNGSSWKNAYTNLQSALSNLNCTTILVSEGIYYTTKGLNRDATFKLRNSLRIFGGFPNGGGQANPAAHITILSGDIGVRGDAADNSYHVVTADKNDLSAILDGFTIQGGNANNTNEPMPAIRTDRGGGVYVEGGNPTLRTLVIRANSAVAGGCGMYLNSGSPVITDVKFVDNNQTAAGGYDGNGGGVWSEGNSSPVLTRVQFTSNIAAIAGGGFFSTGNPTLTDVGFYNNEAGYAGGGMYNVGNASLTRVIYQGNSNNSDGGGLYIASGDVTIRSSQFISNFSRVGGGLSVFGSVTMIDSLIDQNMAGRGGGGLYTNQDSSGTYINLVVTRNQSSNPDVGSGAGIFNYSTTSHFTNLLVANNSGANCSGMINLGGAEVINATVVGNHSSEDHSVICVPYGSTKLTNTIVWGNTGELPGPDIAANSQLYITASMLEQGCPSAATCAGLVPGSPQFSDPTNNDFHLKANSPAIGAGSNAALPADTFDLDGDGNVTEKIPFDLDGSPRIAGSRVDLGAYEARAPAGAGAVVYLPYICR